MSQTVESLSDVETYRAARAHIFRSPQSLKWFMATNIGRLRRRKVGSILLLPDELVQDQSQASEMFTAPSPHSRRRLTRSSTRTATSTSTRCSRSGSATTRSSAC